MKRTTFALVAGAVAGGAAYAGVIPGVGGVVDPGVLAQGASSVEALRDAEAQAARLNSDAMMRAVGIAVAVAVAVYLFKKG